MKKSTSKIHLELLSPDARSIFLNINKFKPNCILGGGTAIMLLLEHRRSFDLDIFCPSPIEKDLLTNLQLFYKEKLERPIVDTSDELSIVISHTKVSFIYFPFKPLHPSIKTDSIDLFSLEDSASNKAYVIGRRGAWRDYVDLFYLIKNGVNFENVIAESKKRFGGTFSEKLFLEQLIYWNDLSDFTVDYLGKSYKNKEIQDFFKKLVASFVRKKF